MINKPVEAQVIGRSKDIPEGIFGAIEMPPDNSNPERPKKKKKKVKDEKKFLHIGGHKVELTDMVHIDFSLKGGVKKKKRVKKLGKPKLKALDIHAPKAKKKKRTPSVMPAMEINYESMMPSHAEGLQMENVVRIPEEVLKKVARKTEKRTKELSSLMLNNVTPSMLSYDAASNYVKAALADGLKIDVEIDRGVLEVVKELSRLDVIFFYLKRLSLPKSMKKHFMTSFIEEMSKGSLEAMKKADKSDAFSSQLREMEAVISKRSEHQQRQTKTRKNTDDKRVGLTEDLASGKRTRKDSGTSLKPLMGGF